MKSFRTPLTHRNETDERMTPTPANVWKSVSSKTFTAYSNGLFSRALLWSAGLLVCVAFVCVNRTSFAADEPLILAVHPFLPEAEIRTRFAPFIEYLSKELGRSIQIRVGADYNTHIKAIGNSKVDFAYMGPESYVKLTQQFGQKSLLARLESDGKSELFGVIAVRKESTLKSFADLRGVNFAFGARESTMSHLVQRYMMIKAGFPKGLPAEHKFLGSHRNVALALLAGDYDAGAMLKNVFDEYEAKGLRMLALTPPTPDHVFVARSDMPKADIEKIQQAMLRLKDQKNGPAILDKIQKGTNALGLVNDKDYDGLRLILNAVMEADAQK